MKAAVFKALGQPLVVETLPDPTPRPDQVVVKVAGCGVCGSDLKLTESPVLGLKPDFVLGHEYAGEVVEVGNGVKRIHLGDHVAVFPVWGCGHCPACLSGSPAWCSRMRVDGGGYGQYSLTTERQCIKLPPNLPLEYAALVEPLAVGLHGIELAKPSAGSSALVIGCGPIGLTTAFWALRFGAGRVAMTARSNRRADLANNLGAIFVEPGDNLLARVQGALGGQPEIVYECVGVPGILAMAIEQVKPEGLIIIQGACTEPDSIVPFGIVAKEARIQGAVFYRIQDFEHSANVMEDNVDLLRTMVTDEIKLDDLPQVFEQLRHRTHQCKVIVRPND